MSSFNQHQSPARFTTPLSAYRTQQYQAMEKFVKHRERCYSSVYPQKLETMSAISTLKRLLDFYRFSSPDDLCRAILKYQMQLKMLIPGEHSRYHAGAKKTVDALINYATAYLLNN